MVNNTKNGHGIKRILASAAAVTMLFGCMAALPEGYYRDSASLVYAEAENGYTYVYYGDGVAIVSCSNYEEELVVPSTLNGKKVVKIDVRAFKQNSKIKTVSLPSTCEILEEGAFLECENLESITLPLGLKKIGAGAFKGCTNLQNLDIPRTVTNIGANAFEGTKWLDDKKASYAMIIENGLLIDASKMKDDVIIPSSVKIICAGAFANNDKITSLKMSDSVTNIDSEAFKGCKNLKTVRLSGKLTSLGDYSFSKTGIETIVLPEGMTYTGKYTFDGCESLRRVTLPSTLKTVGGNCFGSCTSLLKIRIPDNVTKIEDWAFYSCSGLKKIKLDENLTEMGNGVFYDCKSLENIVIPDSLTSFGTATFTDGLTLICTEGSAAHEYAESEGLPYSLIDKYDDPYSDVLGDVNNDGKLDDTDVKMLTDHVNGTKLLDDDSNADVDESGTIDFEDVKALKKIIAELKKKDESSTPDSSSSSKKPDNSSNPDNKKGKLGDVNSDSKIDIEDAVLIIQNVNGMRVLSDSEAKKADVNKSGNVDIEDAVAVIAYVNGNSDFNK